MGVGEGAAAVGEEGIDACGVDGGGRGEVLDIGVEWRGGGLRALGRGEGQVPCGHGAAVGEKGVYEGDGDFFVDGGGAVEGWAERVAGDGSAAFSQLRGGRTC